MNTTRLDFSGLLNIGTVSCGVFEAFNKTLSEILQGQIDFILKTLLPYLIDGATNYVQVIKTI